MRANGQIQYLDANGDMRHSDLIGDPNDPEYRKFLHDNLDEYLDNLHRQCPLNPNPNDPNLGPDLWNGAHFVVMKY